MPNFKKSKVVNSSRGFTLMEMLVTVAIIGIMCLLGTPNYLDLTRNFNKSNVKIQLLQDVRRAQATTVTEGCRGIIMFASDGKSYNFGCDYLPYTTANPPSPDSIKFTKTMPKGFTAAADARLIFNSKGQIVDAGGVLDTRTVTVTLSGSTVATGTLRPTGFFTFN